LMAHFEEKFRKRLETRPRATNHRGWLAIHAAQDVPSYALLEYEKNPQAREALARLGVRDERDLFELPRGVVVCVVRVVTVVATDEERWPLRTVLPAAGSFERAFGNYRPGRSAWVTRDCHILREPVKCRGAQIMFDVPPEVVRQIERQLPQPAFS
jgi:hypothetical protein